ncbi:hypothetical protein SDC9_123956 [bioreactor metagenome]|uniref:Uncharacterized protein n=1 Tax=bioreactor metagenome TaxID=1076179 RepID=A0A645CJ25_9ZZZZ
MADNDAAKIHQQYQNNYFPDQQGSQKLARVSINAVQHVIVDAGRFFSDGIAQLIGRNKCDLHA